MKFHNQRSFMGHEISNVNNKPLLRKKGKQWIVVAVSALILAGFGGMVSTTTHADTTAAQPTTTKVAPKPANVLTPKATQSNTKNIGQQATDLHVKLLSQAPVKTNSSNLRTTPNPSQHVKASGYWMYAGEQANNETPQWNLYSDGNLVISKNSHSSKSSDMLENKSNTDNSQWASSMTNLKDVLENMTNSDAQQVTTLSFSHVFAPSESTRLLDDESNSGYFNNLSTLDLRGLSLDHVTDGTAMFGGLRGLTNVIGLKTPRNFNASLLFVNDKSLKSVDLSNMYPISSSTGGMFAYDDNLTTITLGSDNSLTGSELFNGDGVAMPSNQATWTPLNGNKVTVGYGNNNNTLSKNNTWTVGNTPLQATDTIKYINSENGKPILCNNIHPGHGGDYATLTGTYGTYVSSSVWGDWTATNMPAFDTLTQNPNPKYSDDINPSNLSSKNIKYNGTTYTVQITPNQANSTVNYVDQNRHNEGNYTFRGDSDNANGAIKQTFGYTPKGLNSGYYVIKPSDQIQFDNGTHTETVAPKVNQTINFQWFDRSVGGTTMQNLIPGTTANITSDGLKPGWHLNNGTYQVSSNGTFTVQQDGSTINDGVEPDQVTDPIAYQYNGTTISTNNSYQGDDYRTAGSNISNATFTLGNDPKGMPTGFHLANSSDANKSRNFDGTTQDIAIEPNTDNDYLIYKLNTNHNHQIGTSTDKSNGYISGNDHNAGQAKGVNIPNTTFTVSNNTNDPNLPEGYHVVSGDGNGTNGLIFNHQNGSHVVYVAPNTVTVNYKNKENNKVVSSKTATFNGNSKDISAPVSNFGTPTGYQLINGESNNRLSFTNNNSVTVQVTPQRKTDTITYMNGMTPVSSASSTGNDYQAQNASDTQFTVTSAPVDYQLVPNCNNTFNYNGSHYDVKVEPIQNNQKTDVLNYMNGDVKVASDVYTGNDMYAPNVNHTSFNANDYVPAGYHVVNDGGNTFYFDGQTHDVTVYPNSITLEFNNGQAGSKKIDNLKGTTYQIKSSDVPANYQLTNSSDDVIDLGNLGKSTEYNVDVSPVPQSVTPASDNIQPAPYIPSMPTSVASSASSVAYVPASASSTISKPSNEAMPSHYRYTKVVTPLQLHTSKHFTKKNGVLTIKHPTSFKIMKIVHDHKLIRYEVKYQGRNYFITSNDHFTINNYVQKHDFKSHKHMMVKVITPMIEYKHAHFNKKNAIKVFKKGAVLPVKRVFTIGKGEMTRFELTNGRYVTSNKLFVKVIK